MGARTLETFDNDSHLERMLQALGGANAALLLLPLLLLATLPLPSNTLASGCGGWVTQRLARCCAVAVLCHWLGLVFALGQLAFLAAATDAKLTFDWFFTWHSVAPVLLTMMGSMLGVISLWGHLSIVHGDCSAFPCAAAGVAVLAAASMILLYMVLFRQALRSTRRTAARRPDEGSTDGSLTSFSLAIDSNEAGPSWVVPTPVKHSLDPCEEYDAPVSPLSDVDKFSVCHPDSPSRPAVSQAAAAVATAGLAAGAVDADAERDLSGVGETSQANMAANPGAAHTGVSAEVCMDTSGDSTFAKPCTSSSSAPADSRGITSCTGNLNVVEGSSTGSDTHRVSISITSPDGKSTALAPSPSLESKALAASTSLGGREQFTGKRHKLMRLSLPEVASPRRQSAGGEPGSSGASASGAGIAADQPAIAQWRGKFAKRGSAPVLCRKFSVASSSASLGNSAPSGRHQPQCPLNTRRPSSPSGMRSPMDLDTRFAEVFEMRQRALSLSAKGPALTDKEADVLAPAAGPAAAWTADGVGPTATPEASLQATPEASSQLATFARGTVQAAAKRRDLLTSTDESVHIFQTDPINYDKVFDNTMRGSHKEDKVEYAEVQGEEDESLPDVESIDEEEEDGEDDDDEVWNCGQVEVPIWLLDRMKADGWQPPEDMAEEAIAEQEEDDESSGEVSVAPSDVSALSAGTNAAATNMQSTAGDSVAEPQKESMKRHDRHVSFSDQRQEKTGPMLGTLATVAEKAEGLSDDSSEECSTSPPVSGSARGSSRKNSRSPQGSRVGDIVPPKTFWKIPLPTRKNSMLGVPQDSMQPSAQATTTPPPPPPPPALSTLHPPPPATGVRRLSGVGLASRRRSSFANALGLINDEAAKMPGLYAVPKEEDGTGEIIEIRRRSLVMSTSMLSNIIQSKVGQDRVNQQLPSTEEENGDEVVLPLFRPEQKYVPRQCTCKVDPVTGYVIHTCMTPATTAAENTQAFQSFICSEWNSRRASRRNSRPQSGARSRRGSAGAANGESGSSMKKRIRNASMLEQIGKKGPKPARKGTDVPEEDDGDEHGKGEDEEIGAENENELAVSFANIHGGCTTSPASRRASESELSGSSSADTMTPAERRSVAADSGGANGTDLSPQSIPGAVFVEPGRHLEDTIGQRFDLIEPYHLAAMLQDERREQLLIVDVRGRDWAGGHIPFSINLRTTEVMMNPASVLFQCRRSRINHVVFTCMYSVLRARKCVVAVDAQQEEEQKAGVTAFPIRISLLAGGFHAWMNYFAREASTECASSRVSRKYVDSFDPHMWSDGGPSQGGLVHVMDALWSSGGQKALSDALTQELQTLATRLSPAVSQGTSANTSRRGSEQSVNASRRCSEQGSARMNSEAVSTGQQQI